jgi:tripeptidyl-peptidase-1
MCPQSGRAYPDVAAQANDLTIVMQGKVTGATGTSASSPIFAATIALLNDKLYAAGTPPSRTVQCSF